MTLHDQAWLQRLSSIESVLEAFERTNLRHLSAAAESHATKQDKKKSKQFAKDQHKGATERAT